MIDQRGTGDRALDCPALQREMGFSDLQRPTPGAVRACAAEIGPKRAFYGTDDTVRDLDHLRRALGVGRMAIDGTSYGTSSPSATRLPIPRHVSRLVLDSVVPHEASGQLETQAFPRVTQVLRNVCGRCADDLRAVVARYRNGTKLLDAIVTLSVIDPTFRPRSTCRSVLARPARQPAADERMLAGFREARRRHPHPP